jgi:histidine ammonia-lyase
MSENKQLAHPASIDSAPTSANQEDHVSMATHGARRLLQMNVNLSCIIAIELMAAAEGIDFRRPLTSSGAIEAAHQVVRGKVVARENDRAFSEEIEAVAGLVREGMFDRFVPGLLRDLGCE